MNTQLYPNISYNDRDSTHVRICQRTAMQLKNYRFKLHDELQSNYPFTMELEGHIFYAYTYLYLFAAALCTVATTTVPC